MQKEENWLIAGIKEAFSREDKMKNDKKMPEPPQLPPEVKLSEEERNLIEELRKKKEEESKPKEPEYIILVCPTCGHCQGKLKE